MLLPFRFLNPPAARPTAQVPSRHSPVDLHLRQMWRWKAPQGNLPAPSSEHTQPQTNNTQSEAEEVKIDRCAGTGRSAAVKRNELWHQVSTARSVNPSFVPSKKVCETSRSHHRGIMAEYSAFCTASTCGHVTYLPPPYLLLPAGSKHIRTWQRRKQEHLWLFYSINQSKNK